jgi:hypothetical protein
VPPITLSNSVVNLKGAYSSFKPLPGKVVNTNPKSICAICPSLSSNILALCLSLIYSI